jgi:hypothetical protein
MNDEILDLKERAIKNIQEPIVSLESLIRRLRRWWCRHYGRPYKDPLLDSYRWQELLMEYYEVSIMEGTIKIDGVAEEKKDDYEEWLVEEMGDSYQTFDQMVEGYSKHEEK